MRSPVESEATGDSVIRMRPYLLTDLFRMLMPKLPAICHVSL